MCCCSSVTQIWVPMKRSFTSFSLPCMRVSSSASLWRRGAYFLGYWIVCRLNGSSPRRIPWSSGSRSDPHRWHYRNSGSVFSFLFLERGHGGGGHLLEEGAVEMTLSFRMHHPLSFLYSTQVSYDLFTNKSVLSDCCIISYDGTVAPVHSLLLFYWSPVFQGELMIFWVEIFFEDVWSIHSGTACHSFVYRDTLSCSHSGERFVRGIYWRNLFGGTLWTVDGGIFAVCVTLSLCMPPPSTTLSSMSLDWSPVGTCIPGE